MQNRTFKRVIKSAQLTIIDGVGIEIAAQMLNIEAGERYPGVDLMNNLISHISNMSLTVLFLGGQTNLAEELAKCYHQNYPQTTFIGIQGIKNIKKPTREEEKEISRIVRVSKPQMVFVAFGSPAQEVWIYKNKRLLSGRVCMGVGGAFDYLTGRIQRPKTLFRTWGMEWLVRLIRQPWRAFRQLRLIIFIYFVIKQKVHEALEIKKSG
ncbi:WecB/TagA/CpsF family glycosyltransferase [Candidatus Roizmanbacteria bacterium]|nr:WecB/TagA/CpsF family glycosyltransferase [Candidatus Roizmanbacteria bacterium]